MGWTTITPSCGLDLAMTATPSRKFLFGMNQLSIQFTIIYFLVSNKMLFFNMFHHWPSFTQIHPRLEKNCLGKRILFRISSGPWFPNFSRRQMAWWTRVSPPGRRHSSRSSSRGSWTGRSAWRCHRSHLTLEAPPTGGWQRGEMLC